MKMPVRIGESRPLHRICLAVGCIQTAKQTAAQNEREAEEQFGFRNHVVNMAGAC